jgi:hypothetical protein
LLLSNHHHSKKFTIGSFSFYYLMSQWSFYYLLSKWFGWHVHEQSLLLLVVVGPKRWCYTEAHAWLCL